MPVLPLLSVPKMGFSPLAAKLLIGKARMVWLPDGEKV